jgi:hypothetical protein
MMCILHSVLQRGSELTHNHYQPPDELSEAPFDTGFDAGLTLYLAPSFHRLVLAGASSYFRRRLEEEGWDTDPWTMMGPDGKPLLVVGVEEELLEAAQAVVRFMYEKVKPATAGPLQLAKVRRAADTMVGDGRDIPVDVAPGSLQMQQKHEW